MVADDVFASMPDVGAAQQVGERIAAETRGFTGGKLPLFAEAGRQTLQALLQNGLKPHHRLLDLGCGALRNGYWLVRYLDADRYFGIEPVRNYVEIGLKHAVGDALMAEKNPRFDYGKDFDFSVFGVTFDFVMARSIFSHAGPDQVRAALASFHDNSTDKGVMLSSYVQDLGNKADAGVEQAQSTEGWALRKHSRLRRYSLDFLQNLAGEYSLRAENFGERYNGQIWLKITKGKS